MDYQTESEFIDQCKTIGQYTIIKEIGQGISGCIKLVVDKNDKKFAIKIYKNSEYYTFQTEVASLSQLIHDNILGLKGYCNKYMIHENLYISFIVLEYAVYGDLFNIIQQSRLGENVSKIYIKQIINAVQYMNRKGFAHRDIKPENILINNNYDFILADFGYTTTIISNNFSGLHSTKTGTEYYMAPEILEQRQYDPSLSDVFSLGIVLFIMIIGHCPFRKAIQTDSFYRHIRENTSSIFWALHLKKKQINISLDVQDLLTQMFQYDTKKRIKMSNILQHQWFQVNDISEQEAKIQIKMRLDNLTTK